MRKHQQNQLEEISNEIPDTFYFKKITKQTNKQKTKTNVLEDKDTISNFSRFNLSRLTEI